MAEEIFTFEISDLTERECICMIISKNCFTLRERGSMYVFECALVQVWSAVNSGGVRSLLLLCRFRVLNLSLRLSSELLPC